MTATGTFNPVKQISQTSQNQSFMGREASKATGEALMGGIIGNQIEQVNKYKSDLALAQAKSGASQQMAGAIFGGINDVMGAAIPSFFGGGGGTGGFTSGSTGGLGDTVRAGDVGKYGSFQDPTADINRALGGSSWGTYG